MEVARLAGVSHQTVSRYLRNDTQMRASTRERIGTAIAELDYRPNLLARAMRTHRTGRLLVLLPPGNTVNSLQTLTGSTGLAREAGFLTEVVMLGDSVEERGARVLELADSGLYEGVLSLTPLAGTGSGSVPVVVSPDYDERMRSTGELADGSRIADIVERLAADGHRHVLHVAGAYAHTSARSRRQAYLDAVERLGLRSHGVVDADWSPATARAAVLDLPAGSPVTALVCASDVLAAGALRGLAERGWACPADASVTGWNDDPWTPYSTPSLTTVATNYEKLGRRAMAELIHHLRPDHAVDGLDGEVTEILWRESTGPARA